MSPKPTRSTKRTAPRKKPSPARAPAASEVRGKKKKAGGAVSGRLARYRDKRDFSVTSEPSPEDKGSSDLFGTPDSPTPRFMVHKHDATRLHYDLRLEMEGVLASWAIPKGPSYDPGIKRLAMQTEDHPLAYGDFEGRIPDGEYGGGDSIIWDRGTYDTVPPGQAAQQRKKGHLKIRLEGEKLKGEWHLVRTRPQGGKEAWLCFKSKDGTENPAFDVVSERPESVATGRRVTRGPVRKKTLRATHPTPEALLEKVWPPMLATLSSPGALGDPADYVFELKYDGYRGLAALSGGKLAFQTRNAIDLSERFPTLAKALHTLSAAEVVLDGELVALDESGIPRFQRLHEDAAQQRFVAFDILWLDGEDLRERPLEERRELLESVMANARSPLELAARIDSPVDVALEALREVGFEGLIAKRRGSRYEPKRSESWLKLKVLQAQEVAIIGYTPISNGKDAVGALLVGVHDGKGFRYAGKIGTGYTDKLRRELRAKLDRDVIERSVAADAPRKKDAVWVKPRFVAQVAFTEWTEDGKLRHPSFQGLRMDKKPEECTREGPSKRKKR